MRNERTYPISWLDDLFSGITIAAAGTEQPQEPVLNFLGTGVAVADDPTNKRTDVTITAGGTAPTGTGLSHVTGGSVDGIAYKGAAGQMLVTNSGGTNTDWVTASGDATISAAGVVAVNKIKGEPITGVPATGDILVFSGSEWVPIPSTTVGNWIVYQPGGVASGNLVTTWADVMTIFAQTTGSITINIDCSFVSPAPVPAGLYALGDRVEIVGSSSAVLDLQDGAQLQDVRSFTFTAINCNNTVIPSLVYSVGAGTFFNQGVFISMLGAAPMIEVGAGATYFVQFIDQSVIDVSGGGPLAHLANASSTFDLFAFVLNAPFQGNGLITGVASSSLQLFYDSSWPIPEPTNPGFSGVVTRAQIDSPLTQLTAARRVQFLAGSGLGTSTLMPANTGDLVTHIHDAATNPSANPTSGAIVWSQGGVVHVRQSDGTTFALGGAFTTPTGTGLAHITAGALDGASYIGTAAQLLNTNAGATGTTWVTVSGDGTLDATGTLAVTKVAGITISGTPAIGNQPVATSTSAASWAALNLAGGANYITGLLPTGNQSQQTMAGDVTGTTGAAAVIAITGTTDDVSVKASSFTWTPSRTPLLVHATQTSDLVTSNFTIRAQYPFATATGANRTPAKLMLDFGSPTNSGTAEGYVGFSRSGSLFSVIGASPTSPTAQAGLWLGAPGFTPSASNACIYGDGASFTYFNAPGGSGSVGFLYNDAVFLQYMNSGGIFFGSGTTASTAYYYMDVSATSKLHFGLSATTAAIVYDAQTADTAPAALTIKGQYAYTSATGANRKPGDVVVDVGAPTNSGTTEGTFKVTRNGSRIADIGVAGNATSYHCLWLGGDPATGNSTAALESDGSSFVYVQTPSGAIGLTIGGTLYAYVTTDAFRFGGNGLNGIGGGSGVLSIADRATAPTSSPTGGGLLYSESGAGKWCGTSGTITTFGPSDPHCPNCGCDFMTEAENPEYGYLSICLKCMADELGERKWIVRKKPV
jgi:hypothetical protein